MKLMKGGRQLSGGLCKVLGMKGKGGSWTLSGRKPSSEPGEEWRRSISLTKAYSMREGPNPGSASQGR